MGSDKHRGAGQSVIFVYCLLALPLHPAASRTVRLRQQRIEGAKTPSGRRDGLLTRGGLVYPGGNHRVSSAGKRSFRKLYYERPIDWVTSLGQP